MVMFVVTPVRNVLVTKRCFKSERPDLFFNKVIKEDIRIDVYDVSERRQKALFVREINTSRHRMIINNEKFFICSIKKCG